MTASPLLGGPPLAVAFRLILLCVLVGVILAALGFDPCNIIESIRRLFQRSRTWASTPCAGLWRYFLLGAIIVVPIWLILRVRGAARA